MLIYLFMGNCHTAIVNQIYTCSSYFYIHQTSYVCFGDSNNIVSSLDLKTHMNTSINHFLKRYFQFFRPPPKKNPVYLTFYGHILTVRIVLTLLQPLLLRLFVYCLWREFVHFFKITDGSDWSVWKGGWGKFKISKN